MIYGPDVSHYQGAVNHAAIRAGGCDFLIAKISEGSGSRDAQWPRNRDGARAAGLITVGYHYITTADPGAQARNCRGWIGDAGVPVALDLERGGGNIANYAAVLAAFRAAGMRVVFSYIPPFYWAEIGHPDLAPFPPLWKARYYSMTPAPYATMYAHVPPTYWDPYGGQFPQILQYGDAGQVAGLTCDVNAYRGTRDQFAALVGAGGGPAPVVPTPTEVGFLAALNDAEQHELLASVRTLHYQLVEGETDGKGKWGWRSFDGAEVLTPVDYLRRLYERTGQANTKLDALAAAVRGVAGVDPAAVTDVLRTAVAAAGFQLHGTITAADKPVAVAGQHPAAGETTSSIADDGTAGGAL